VEADHFWLVGDTHALLPWFLCLAVVDGRSDRIAK